MDFFTFVVIVVSVAVGAYVHYHRHHLDDDASLNRIAHSILERERVGWEARRARDEIRRVIRRTLDAMK
jgi:uncharacterized membrane protein (DUF106 family)